MTSADLIGQEQEIQVLVDIISNTIEAYTTALFISPKSGEPLVMAAYQSLSANINQEVTIGEGEGLVGWVYKNNEPVTVDKFDQDTRRLLFYTSNEAIKSFMAVPLPAVNGVLAVDSKNRYVFTEKSQKILVQFARALEQAVIRGRSVRESKLKQEAIDFLNDLDEALFQRNAQNTHLKKACQVIRKYFDSEACFLSAILPEDPSLYRLLAQNMEQSLKLDRDIFRVDQGLIGWMIKEKKPLNLKRARLDTDKSYIFYPEDPFHDFTSVTGLPLISGRRIMGSICLAGKSPFEFDDTKARAFELGSARVAAAVETDLLSQRLGEISALDPLTGLAHRSEFCRKAEQAIKSAGQASLTLVKIQNLENIIVEFGQRAADSCLLSTVKILKEHSNPEAQLGHPIYGVFGILVPGAPEPEAAEDLKVLEHKLQSQVIKSSKGQARVQVKTFYTNYKGFSKRAEDLIREGLSAL